MDLKLKIFIFLALLAIYIWYIVIVKRKNQVLECLSGIDVQLTKRYDLIPNILKIAKKFMEHENTLMNEVTSLRAKVPMNYQHNSKEDIAAYFKANNDLATKMANLLMQVENYPQLKSDQTMLQAQMTYNEIEEHISASRRFYNSAVNSFNNAIQIFPGNFIAKLAKAKPMPFYQVNEAQKSPIDANQLLK